MTFPSSKLFVFQTIWKRHRRRDRLRSLAEDSGEERIVDLRGPSQSIKPLFLNLFREERILRAASMRTKVLLSTPGRTARRGLRPNGARSNDHATWRLNSYREARPNADLRGLANEGHISAKMDGKKRTTEGRRGPEDDVVHAVPCQCHRKPVDRGFPSTVAFRTALTSSRVSGNDRVTPGGR